MLTISHLLYLGNSITSILVTARRNAKYTLKPKDTAKRLYSKAQGREAHPGSKTPTRHKTLKGFYRKGYN